jgi:hypothetical protein
MRGEELTMREVTVRWTVERTFEVTLHVTEEAYEQDAQHDAADRLIGLLDYAAIQEQLKLIDGPCWVSDGETRVKGGAVYVETLPDFDDDVITNAVNAWDSYTYGN